MVESTCFDLLLLCMFETKLSSEYNSYIYALLILSGAWPLICWRISPSSAI